MARSPNTTTDTDADAETGRNRGVLLAISIIIVALLIALAAATAFIWITDLGTGDQPPVPSATFDAEPINSAADGDTIDVRIMHVGGDTFERENTAQIWIVGEDDRRLATITSNTTSERLFGGFPIDNGDTAVIEDVPVGSEVVVVWAGYNGRTQTVSRLDTTDDHSTQTQP